MIIIEPGVASSPDDLPPRAVLMRLLSGSMVAQALAAAAELSVAEQLVDGPRTSEEIAAAIRVHPPTLYRLLRALAEVGVLRQDGEHFALTDAGQLLRGDVSGSFRALAIFQGRPWHQAAWAALANSVRTGESAFLQVYGKDQFEWFQAHPEEGALLHTAMASLGSATADAVVDAYDFSGSARVADVGGGHGVLLSKILQVNPSVHGVLFDLPHVVDGARALFHESGLSTRCDLVGGDFFDSVTTGLDAYVLAHVLHDWDDARCETILRNCRRAMAAGARVLLVELVVPPPGVPSFAGLTDLQMLVISSNGRERTEQEFADLLARAGLALTRVVPTRSSYSVIEAFNI